MQPFHHPDADRVRRHFVVVQLLEFLDDFFHCALQSIVTDRALLAGLDHSAQHFLPIKRFMPAIPLDDSQIATLDFFIGCESMLAGKAFPSTSYSRAGL